jgi:5-methylcytosine-specific restriction endonuclease McrA
MGLTRSNQKNYIKQPEKEKSNEPWGTNNRFYHTKFWRDTREAFRSKKDQPNERPGRRQTCQMCHNASITRGGYVVDHIIPVPAGADIHVFMKYSNEDNLQILCEAHHNQKTNKENK